MGGAGDAQCQPGSTPWHRGDPNRGCWGKEEAPRTSVSETFPNIWKMGAVNGLVGDVPSCLFIPSVHFLLLTVMTLPTMCWRRKRRRGKSRGGRWAEEDRVNIASLDTSQGCLHTVHSRWARHRVTLGQSAGEQQWGLGGIEVVGRVSQAGGHPFQAKAHGLVRRKASD